MSSMSDAIKIFETVQIFICAHEMTENDQKYVVHLENMLFSLKDEQKLNIKFPIFKNIPLFYNFDLFI